MQCWQLLADTVPSWVMFSMKFYIHTFWHFILNGRSVVCEVTSPCVDTVILD